MTHETRPVDDSDWHRLSCLLYALSDKAAGDDRELWAILVDLHEHLEAPRGVTPLSPDQLIGDEAAAREIHHAHIVVEGMMIHHGQVPAKELAPAYRVCEAPDCPELTHTRLCPIHELTGYDGDR